MAESDDADRGINTRLAHLGNDPHDYFGFVNPPVVHASTVLYPDAATMASRRQKYTYGTRGTPTTDALAAPIDALEGLGRNDPCAFGARGCHLPLLGLPVGRRPSPDRRFRLSPDPQFRRHDAAGGWASRSSTIDPAVGAGIAGRLKPNTRVVFTEIPGSNTFEMQDVPAIADAAHRQRHRADAGQHLGHAALLPRRSTTASTSRSIAATKYPAGHSDVLFGTVVGQCRSLAAAARRLRCAVGACPGPDDVYQVLRGLRTLGVRLERHQYSALGYRRAGSKAGRTSPASCTRRWTAIPTMPCGSAISFGATGIFSFVLGGPAGRRRTPSSMR